MQFVTHWMPHWIVGTVIMVVPAVIALLLYRWCTGALARLAARYSPFLQQLLSRDRGPTSALVVVVVLGIALPAASFPAPLTFGIGHTLVFAFVVAVGWWAAQALDLGAELYVRRFRTDTPDNLLARKHLTQINILRRAALTLLVIVTISAALMTIPDVRQYGVSLLASAGAAGIVVGLAARPVLSNLLAGIQIAITQPIRVEDVVIVEGQWGWIETITSTYVVVRIWNLQRLVLPLTYFIENPFQNWTYQSADLIGTVQWSCDYRCRSRRGARSSTRSCIPRRYGDGKVAALQVTEALGTTLASRAGRRPQFGRSLGPALFRPRKDHRVPAARLSLHAAAAARGTRRRSTGWASRRRCRDDGIVRRCRRCRYSAACGSVLRSVE
jgi:small-conductance mechanosensitive channel